MSILIPGQSICLFYDFYFFFLLHVDCLEDIVLKIFLAYQILSYIFKHLILPNFSMACSRGRVNSHKLILTVNSGATIKQNTTNYPRNQKFQISPPTWLPCWYREQTHDVVAAYLEDRSPRGQRPFDRLITQLTVRMRQRNLEFRDWLMEVIDIEICKL